MIVLVLFLVVVAFGEQSLQQDIAGAKSQMETFRADAESRMRAALGERPHVGVLIGPLRRLSELKSAGEEDLENIAAFQGPGDKEEATQKSIQFWKDKMEEVIEPYITNPERYKGLIIDHAFLSEDPTWNSTEAYKKIEKELNAMSEEAFKKLREELEKKAVPASRLEEVTETTWKKLEGKRAYDTATFFISFSRQHAKNSAAGGGKRSEYLKMLTDAIEGSSNEFYKKINEIYK